MEKRPPNHSPPPDVNEFEATHLRAWLAERARMEQSVLTWVVRTARRLEGLPLDNWEWVTRRRENEPYDDTAPPAR